MSKPRHGAAARGLKEGLLMVGRAPVEPPSRVKSDQILPTFFTLDTRAQRM